MESNRSSSYDQVIQAAIHNKSNNPSRPLDGYSTYPLERNLSFPPFGDGYPCTDEEVNNHQAISKEKDVQRLMTNHYYKQQFCLNREQFRLPTSHSSDSVMELYNNSKSTIISHSGKGENSNHTPDKQRKHSQSSKDKKLLPKIIGISKSVDKESQANYRTGFSHHDFYSICLDFKALLQRGQLWKQHSSTGASAAANTVESIKSYEGDKDLMYSRHDQIVSECPQFVRENGEYQGKNYTQAQDWSLSSCGFNNITCNSRSWKIYGDCNEKDGQSIEKFEFFDYGAHFYRDKFYGKEHFNYFGIDSNIGPIAVSLRRIKATRKKNGLSKSHTNGNKYYAIVRSSQLETLRGSLAEDVTVKLYGSKTDSFRLILQHITPEIDISCLKQGQDTEECTTELVQFDEQLWLSNVYKFGVLYCKKEQLSEEDMYRNCDSSPRFDRFLSILGDRISLFGFQGYKGQLDTRGNTTGIEAVYTRYCDNQIMYHVSTLLPYAHDCEQQLMRKRHIGNDIVTFIFQENDAPPFSPRIIRSNFQHIFIVVRPVYDASQNLVYKVAISTASGIADFEPPLPKDGIFVDEDELRDFLLTKAINGENSTKRSNKFRYLAMRTRMQYLKDMCERFSTNISIDYVPKLAFFSPMKQLKIKNDHGLIDDTIGGFAYRVQRCDGEHENCVMVITVIAILIIEAQQMKLIYSLPCKSILGWLRKDLRIYYHDGASATFRLLNYQSIMDIDNKLDHVSGGHRAFEVSLRLSTPGSHGLCIDSNGIVAKIDDNSLAEKSSLKPGYKIIEICGVPVTTTRYDDIKVHLAYTSDLTLVYIMPFSDIVNINIECFEGKKKHNLFKKLTSRKHNEDSRQDLSGSPNVLHVRDCGYNTGESSDNSSTDLSGDFAFIKAEDLELPMANKDSNDREKPILKPLDSNFKKVLKYTKGNNKSLDEIDCKTRNSPSKLRKKFVDAIQISTGRHSPDSDKRRTIFDRRKLELTKSNSLDRSLSGKHVKITDEYKSQNTINGKWGYLGSRSHSHIAKYGRVSPEAPQIDSLIQEASHVFSSDKAGNAPLDNSSQSLSKEISIDAQNRVPNKLIRQARFHRQLSTGRIVDVSSVDEREV